MRIQPNKFWSKGALVYVVLVAAVCAGLGFGLDSVYGGSSASSSSTRTATVQRGTVQAVETASGNLSSVTSTALDFSTSGTLTAVDVAVGDNVTVGEALATIDAKQAQESLTSARAALTAAEENLANAEAGGSVSQLSQEAASLESAKLTLQSDEQQLTSDETSLATTKSQLVTDESLGCPGTTSGSAGTGSTSSNSNASSSSTGSSSTGSSQSATGSTGGSGGTESAQLKSDDTTESAGDTDPATASQPTVTTNTASGVTTGGATLNGTVDPNGVDTSYYFQYGVTAVFGSSTFPTDAGSGFAAVSVSTEIDGLGSARTYYYRLVAKNSLGTSYGSVETFTTGGPPTATTGSGSGATTTTSTLSGTVNPEGVDTTYYFQYGTTASLGSTTAAGDAGAGTTAESVSTIVTGLTPDTTYDFRLVATNELGSADGVTETFATAESSCVADRTTISTDEETVAHQELVNQQQRQSIASTEAGDVTSPVTIVGDEATVAADQDTVSTDEQALSETTLTSPIAGTVTAVNGSVSETVSGSNSASSSNSGSGSTGSTGASASSSSSSSSSSSGFITITNLHSLEVVSPFAEADISNIAVGDPSTVSLAALPNTDLAARVTAVAPTSTVSSNVVTYDVTIAIEDPPSDVKVGMTANVSVITASRTGVMVLPSAAITTTGTISTVALLEHGTTVTREVVTGLVGSSTTQIVSGLKVGDVVVEPTVSISSTGTSGTSSSGGARSIFGGGGLAGGGLAGG